MFSRYVNDLTEKLASKCPQGNIDGVFTKDEVFYIQSGKILVKYSDNDEIGDAKELILEKGDNFHVYRGLRHRMIALEDTELFEFSTQHFDSDSYRIEKGD